MMKRKNGVKIVAIIGLVLIIFIMSIVPVCAMNSEEAEGNGSSQKVFFIIAIICWILAIILLVIDEDILWVMIPAVGGCLAFLVAIYF